MENPKADIIFESSWEVCNKVGGIYTVVKSKISPMMHAYRNRKYVLIGPFFPGNQNGEFEEQRAPERFKKVFEILAKEGLSCHYGRWLASEKPETVLIDFKEYYYKKNDIKKELWEKFKIDSLASPNDFDEPIIWSWGVGRFIHEFAKLSEDKKIVAHFHEWMAGAALLYLKDKCNNLGTVFTTHATMIGRTLASQNIDIYSNIEQIDAYQESYRNGMHYKHQTEVACAQNASTFTTVSEITGIEAEHFLGRKPDVLVLNGLDMNRFPTFEESSIRHRRFRAKIREFILSYFFPYYQFEISETLIFFICGRYEFHDKGIDILTKALSGLNEKLKKTQSKKTIITFFFIPGNQKGIKHDVLENVAFFNDLRDTFNDNQNKIQTNLISSIVSKKEINEDAIFPQAIKDEIHIKLRRFLRDSEDPPLSTHDLYNEYNDAIISSFYANNLQNKKEDRVKVILYPIYLKGADGLLNTDYYETITGSHMGIFPSYYEPWGYTPLETSALGVASVTTDLAGFGRYIMNKSKRDKNKGIFVIKRQGKSDEEAIKELTDSMFNFSMLSIHDRIENKINAKSLANLADWEILINNYIKAHNDALTKRNA